MQNSTDGNEMFNTMACDRKIKTEQMDNDYETISEHSSEMSNLGRPPDDEINSCPGQRISAVNSCDSAFEQNIKMEQPDQEYEPRNTVNNAGISPEGYYDLACDQKIKIEQVNNEYEVSEPCSGYNNSCRPPDEEIIPSAVVKAEVDMPMRESCDFKIEMDNTDYEKVPEPYGYETGMMSTTESEMSYGSAASVKAEQRVDEFEAEDTRKPPDDETVAGNGNRRSGRAAAKKARLTLQSQLKEIGDDDNNDSDDEFDLNSVDQPKSNRRSKKYAALETEDFKKNKTVTDNNKTHRVILPKPSAVVPETLASTDTSAIESNTDNQQSTADQSKEGNQQIKVSRRGRKPTTGNQNTGGGRKPDTSKNKGYICVMCEQLHMSQRKIRLHLTQHLNYRSVPCCVCSMEFITIEEAKFHHAGTHPGTPYTLKVTRDPKTEMELNRLVKECQQKAEKETVVVEPVPSAEPETSEENMTKFSNSIEVKGSIQCQLCQVLLDSIQEFKVHCEKFHQDMSDKLEWMDMQSKGIYDLQGKLLRHGSLSFSNVHRYLCALCPFRTTQRELVAKHAGEFHSGLIWMVSLNLTRLALADHQNKDEAAQSSSASASGPSSDTTSPAAPAADAISQVADGVSPSTSASQVAESISPSINTSRNEIPSVTSFFEEKDDNLEENDNICEIRVKEEIEEEDDTSCARTKPYKRVRAKPEYGGYQGLPNSREKYLDWKLISRPVVVLTDIQNSDDVKNLNLQSL